MSSTLIRWGSIAAMFGGLAWVAKFIAIAITGADRQLQPLEGILYFTGWFGFIGGLVAVVALVTSQRGRLIRIGTFALLLPLMAVASIILIDLVKVAVSPAYEGFLKDELGILLIGIAWLIVGSMLRSGRPCDATAAGLAT